MDYGMIKSIIALVAILVAGGYFLYRVYQMLWDNLRHGQPSSIEARFGERLKSLLVYVGGQLKLFRVLIPGTAHFFIFWGFLLLSLTILQAMLEGLLAFRGTNFVLPFLGTLGPLVLIQDLFAVFVSIAVFIGLYTRLVVNPERYRGSHKSQGVIVLFFILTIMLSLLVMNGIRINLGEDVASAWRPISMLVGSLFAGLPASTQFAIGEAAYWIHLGVVLVFLTELPGGKHFHVVTSLPAVYLRDLDPPGRLPPAPEFGTDVGVRTIEQFTWRQMLDFYTCTECGRCQDVCPAYASGLELSPKILIMRLRDELIRDGNERRAIRTNENGFQGRDLNDSVFSEEFLWACTSCMACDQECPLFVEHVKPIVDMRRHLVIEGRVDDMLQEALANLGRYGNSFGQAERARAKWARELDPPLIDARRQAVNYLWFVGDFASYNASCTASTLKTAEVFRKGGLDFGILYDGERNAGNDVRRVGEEGLFEMLQEQNMAELGRSKYEAIVTTDPHTYNTLKHEYPFNGDLPEIYHYSEVLDRMLSDGSLKIQKGLSGRATFHDPCYLGRYNGIYDPPRRVIEATGLSLVEMPNHHDRAVCCGAGGGRIWMDEGDVKERPSERRILEAV
ncbi:MAG: heterodisulfide reductase-related iron-sulfur binding cluster, partial [Anaerolineales bacterium]